MQEASILGAIITRRQYMRFSPVHTHPLSPHPSIPRQELLLGLLDHTSFLVTILRVCVCVCVSVCLCVCGYV